MKEAEYDGIREVGPLEPAYGCDKKEATRLL